MKYNARDKEDKLIDVGEPIEAPLPLEADDNKDYQMLIDGYDEPLERAVARDLLRLSQESLREKFLNNVDFDELVGWHKADDERMTETAIEELLSEDKDWVVAEFMKFMIENDTVGEVACQLGTAIDTKYITVKLEGYEINDIDDIDVQVLYVGDIHGGWNVEPIESEVIEMYEDR